MDHTLSCVQCGAVRATGDDAVLRALMHPTPCPNGCSGRRFPGTLGEPDLETPRSTYAECRFHALPQGSPARDVWGARL